MSFTLEVASVEEYDAFQGLRVPTEELEVSSQYTLMLRFNARSYKAGRTVTRIAQLIPNPNREAQLVALRLGEASDDGQNAAIYGRHENGFLIPDQSTSATVGETGSINPIIGGYLLSRHEESLELVSANMANDLSAFASN